MISSVHIDDDLDQKSIMLPMQNFKKLQSCVASMKVTSTIVSNKIDEQFQDVAAEDCPI